MPLLNIHQPKIEAWWETKDNSAIKLSKKQQKSANIAASFFSLSFTSVFQRSDCFKRLQQFLTYVCRA